MDIGKKIREDERALPGMPVFPKTLPAKPPAPPVPATPTPAPKEKVPA